MTGSSDQFDCTLRDIHRQVSHSFQIGVDLQRGRNQPEIHSHWLLEGEQLDGEVINFNFHPVDAGLFRQDLLGQRSVFLHHRVDAVRYCSFNKGCHLKQHDLQLFQFLIKVAQSAPYFGGF